MAVTISGSSPTFSSGYAGGVVTSGSYIATTSGTSVALSTTIPTWAKRITVMWNNVSTTGTSPLQLQIGSGSYTTSGYSSLCEVAGSGVGSTTSTTGFVSTFPTVSTENVCGIVTIAYMGSNIWVQSGTTARVNAGGAYMSSGVVSIGSSIDRIQITTVGGTDTFDNGAMSIFYE